MHNKSIAENGSSTEDIVLKNPTSNFCLSFAFVSVERDAVYLETDMVDGGSTTSCKLENIPEEKAALLVIATVYDRETKFKCIKNVDREILISYNKSTKNHTVFSTERSVLYVSCKKHGC